MSVQSTSASLATRAAETVTAACQLARVVSRAASSPALQSSIAAFAEHEVTIESTETMLHKINEGMLSIDEAVEDIGRSLLVPDEAAVAAR